MALLLAALLLEAGRSEDAATLDEGGIMLLVALLEAAPLLDATTLDDPTAELEGAALLVAEELACIEELTLIEEDGAAPDELATFELLCALEELPTVEELPVTEDDGTSGSTPASSANALRGIETSWPVTSSTNLIVLSQQSSLQQSLAKGSSYAVPGFTPTRLFLLSVVVAVSGLNHIFAMCRTYISITKSASRDFY